MKKTFLMITIVGLTLSTLTCVCAQEQEAAFTLQDIIDRTTPATITENNSIFSVTDHYENTGDEMLDTCENIVTYASEDGIDKINDVTNYSDSYSSNIYYSNDPDDPYYYITSTSGNEVLEQENNEANDMFQNSLFQYSEETTTVTSITEEEEAYLVNLEVANDGEIFSYDTVTIDKESGTITKIVSTYPSAKSDGETTCTSVFDYSDDLVFDDSAKTENQSSSVSDSESESDADKLFFDTEDINGNPVTSEMIKEAKLVLMNLWEPWCGPCVGELPDLAKLYEDYKDKGLLILGVYTTFEMQEDAEAIVAEKGVTYPIIKGDEHLEKYQTSYVPATYAFDGEGHLLETEPFAGARSYEEWEEIIKNYLGE